mmetsp:Transcript_35376/g.72819  ORF Transcript_35376/g.72819 Transcript_35376/m.72819 type:complete len:83 (-) Transcript_35376:667-915(-)
MLSKASPTVTPTLTVPLTPAELRHRTDESDSQSLASQLECPIRAQALKDIPPRPDPATVTLTEPVLGTLAIRDDGNITFATS